MIKTLKFWKKLFDVFCIVCLSGAIFVLPASAAKTALPKKLVLSRRTITLYEGQMKYLGVKKVKPSGASDAVRWESQNKKIVAVGKKNGCVTAKKVGRTRILAISSKTPKVKAAVKVVVRKRPVKKEKTCEISGSVYKPSEGTMARWWEKVQRTYTIVQTKEDYQEMKSILKESFISEYKDIDFAKESLVLCTVGAGGRDKISLEGFCTKFEGKGKMTGILQINRVPPQDEGTVTAVLHSYLGVFRINKKDAAMLDMIRVEQDSR